MASSTSFSLNRMRPPESDVRDYALLHPVEQGSSADFQVLCRCLLVNPPLPFCAPFGQMFGLKEPLPLGKLPEP